MIFNMHPLFLAFFSAAGPAAAQLLLDNPPFRSLGEIYPEISRIHAAYMNDPEIANYLSSATNLTVFAATNDAFTQTYYTSLPLEDPALVHASLQYTIVPGIYSSRMLNESAPLFLPTTLTNPAYNGIPGGSVIEVLKSKQDLLVRSGVYDTQKLVTPVSIP